MSTATIVSPPGGLTTVGVVGGGEPVPDGSVTATVTCAIALGAGTALVCPTLIAAIADSVSPVERAPVVGVYRFWRDMGYALGAVIAGAVADAFGYGGAIAVVAGLTAASGLWVLGDMPATTRAEPVAVR